MLIPETRSTEQVPEANNRQSSLLSLKKLHISASALVVYIKEKINGIVNDTKFGYLTRIGKNGETIQKDVKEIKEGSDNSIYEESVYTKRYIKNIINNEEYNFHDVLTYIEQYTGLDTHPKIFDALLKIDPDFLINNLEKFTGLDPKVAHQKLFDVTLYEGDLGIRKLLNNLEKFTGLDPKVAHQKLFDAAFKEKALNGLLMNLEKLTGLDSKVYHQQLFDATYNTYSNRFLISNLRKLSGLDPKIAHQKLFDYALNKGYNYEIADNIEDFTGLDPKIAHVKIFEATLREGEARGLLIKLQTFVGLDPKVHHHQLFDALIQKGYLSLLMAHFYKLTGLNEKTRSWFEKLQKRKSDIEVLGRYPELQLISGFDEIFRFFIENKQKSLIPLMKKLLVAKYIGVKTNFKGITDLLNTSWMTGKNPAEIKTQLTATFTKLLDLTDAPAREKSLKELENTLRQIKIFDEKTIEQIQLKFVNVVESYFNSIYDRKVKQMFINELGLGRIDNLDEILTKPEIIEGFKMYQSTTINKEQFKQILQHTISNPNTLLDLPNLGKNKSWLASKSIQGKDMKLWTERNEKKYDIGDMAAKADKSKEIEHFVTVANTKLDSLGFKPQKDAGSLVNYFNTEIKKKKELLQKESKLTPEEFTNLYNDLEFQVQSINNLFKETKSKEITSITIYRETDPMKVLMMGNWVDGSCLSFYSTVGNYWSTATNALDINKGIFYIQDQNGNVIGRVLTAIDNDGKLLRFGMYRKGNISVDLDSYFNQYIKKLSEKIGLGLNGEIGKVQLLNGEKWYEDPVQMMS